MSFLDWIVPTAMGMFTAVSLAVWLNPPWYVSIAIGMACGVIFTTWWRSLSAR